MATAASRIPGNPTRLTPPVGMSRRGSIWRGHDVSAGSFHPLRRPPLPTVEENFTSMGRACQSHINDGSAALRTWLSLPEDRWMDSRYYPDLPNSVGFQAFGVTSATNGPIGLMGMHASAQAYSEASASGDRPAQAYSALDGFCSANLAAFGFDYAVFRVANIGMLATANSDPAAAQRFGELSDQTGWWGNIFGAGIYGAAALTEAGKGIESYVFKRKLNKVRAEAERAALQGCRFAGEAERQRVAAQAGDAAVSAHLQQCLRADETVLLDKEKKKVRGSDPRLTARRVDELARRNLTAQAEVAAVVEQTGVLEANIDQMRSLGMCSRNFAPARGKLEQIVRERLSPAALQVHGRQLLVERLRAKRITRMTRRIGADGVREIQNLPAPGAHAARAATVAPARRIVLANIQVSHSSNMHGNAKRFFLYATGAVAMALCCVFTGGLAVLILSIILAAVYSGEFAMSYQRMQDMRNEPVNGPPGRYDSLWPKASTAFCLAAITATVILTVLSGGLLPLAALILSGVVGLLWLTANQLQLGYIKERRQKYIELLMRKRSLQLAEYAYLAEYAKLEQIQNALPKLPQNDQNMIIHYIGRQPVGVSHIDCYRKAVQMRIEESQRLALGGLAAKLSAHFGREAFRGA